MQLVLILGSVLGLAAAISADANAASRPAAELAVDQVRAEALSLLKTGKYDAAYTLYMRLLRERPDDDEINYGLALAAQGSGRYPQALMAYERLTDRYPADATLRLHLARLYMRMNDSEGARRELEMARRFDSSITDDAVDKAMAALEKAQSRWQCRGRLSAGVLYDSNANFGPASDVMTLGIWKDLVIHGVKARDSWGDYINGALDVAWRPGENSAWWLSGDMGFYKRWNFSPKLLTNNEFGWGRLGLGLRRVGSSTMLDLRLKGEVADQSREQRLSVLGPELLFAWAFHPRAQLLTRAAWESRVYSLDIGRDGNYWWAGEYLRLFLGKDNHELLAGVRVTGGTTTEDDYAYTGWEASLRLLLKLPGNVELTPFAAWRKENYAGPATGLERDNRSDTLWRYGVFLAYGITPHLQVDVGWQYGSNDSTSPLYVYTQNSVNMGLTWKF